MNTKFNIKEPITSQDEIDAIKVGLRSQRLRFRYAAILTFIIFISLLYLFFGTDLIEYTSMGIDVLVCFAVLLIFVSFGGSASSMSTQLSRFYEPSHEMNAFLLNSKSDPDVDAYLSAVMASRQVVIYDHIVVVDWIAREGSRNTMRDSQIFQSLSTHKEV